MENNVGRRRTIIWKPIFSGLIVLVAMVGLAVSSGFARKSPDPKGQDPMKQARVLQVEFIMEEIQKLKADHEWLSEKIHYLRAFGREIPDRMTESLKFKASKIKSLNALLARYRKMGWDARKMGKKRPAPSDPVVSEARPGKAAPKAGPAQSLEKALNKAGLGEWLEITGSENGYLLVESRLPVLFAPSRSDVPKGYGAFLKKLAAFLKKHQVKVSVDGYADTDPIKTAKYPSNFELGAARAGAVVRQLVQAGVAPSAFKIGSTGAHGHGSRRGEKWKNLQRHANITIRFKIP